MATFSICLRLRKDPLSSLLAQRQRDIKTATAFCFQSLIVPNSINLKPLFRAVYTTKPFNKGWLCIPLNKFFYHHYCVGAILYEGGNNVKYGSYPHYKHPSGAARHSSHPPPFGHPLRRGNPLVSVLTLD